MKRCNETIQRRSGSVNNCSRRRIQRHVRPRLRAPRRLLTGGTGRSAASRGIFLVGHRARSSGRAPAPALYRRRRRRERNLGRSEPKRNKRQVKGLKTLEAAKFPVWPRRRPTGPFQPKRSAWLRFRLVSLRLISPPLRRVRRAGRRLRPLAVLAPAPRDPAPNSPCGRSPLA